MSYLDIFLGLFLIYGLIRGFWNGFIIELASFVSLLLGVYVAIKFSFLMQTSISKYVSWNPKTIQIVAFIVTFILVVIGVSILAKLLTKIINFASLGIVNKLAGSFFGLLKMVLFLSVGLKMFQKVNENHSFADKSTLDKSLFYSPIQKAATLIYPSLEENIKSFREL
jgi:membrane protein required for colicin V production